MRFKDIMNKDYLKIPCNVGVTHQIVHGKWKVVILNVLSTKTYRFGELHRVLPFIRQGYLTQQLRELERDGLVNREVYKQVPPKVEYSLTQMGRDFIPIIKEMEAWGRKYREKLEEMYPEYKKFESEEIENMKWDDVASYINDYVVKKSDEK